jgi:hypothetical protein
MTVPAIDPVSPWPNELGTSIRASIMPMRAKYQLDILAGGVRISVISSGISNNQCFIMYPFFAVLMTRSETRAKSGNGAIASSIEKRRAFR